jgi:hypothetical protein
MVKVSNVLVYIYYPVENERGSPHTNEMQKLIIQGPVIRNACEA